MADTAPDAAPDAAPEALRSELHRMFAAILSSMPSSTDLESRETLEQIAAALARGTPAAASRWSRPSGGASDREVT